ncbi:MAG TPA: hypothetical protein VGH90_11160, partial [Chthoniobacteraceae bacterium]
ADQLRKAIGDSFSAKYKNVEVTFKGDIVDATELAEVDGHKTPTVDFTILVQLQTGVDESTPVPKPKVKRQIPQA